MKYLHEVDCISELICSHDKELEVFNKQYLFLPQLTDNCPLFPLHHCVPSQSAHNGIYLSILNLESWSLKLLENQICENWSNLMGKYYSLHEDDFEWQHNHSSNSRPHTARECITQFHIMLSSYFSQICWIFDWTSNNFQYHSLNIKLCTEENINTSKQQQILWYIFVPFHFLIWCVLVMKDMVNDFLAAMISLISCNR